MCFKASAISEKNENFEKSTGVLLYQLATKIKSQIKFRTNFLVEKIVKAELKNEAQLNGNPSHLAF